MAYYEMMPAGLPAGLQSGMDSVFNKKFGTSTSYAPGTWPNTVNLMGPLPEKTIVSSPVADFSDGADDVPTKALIVTIPPTLSGVSTITEKQTGRNLLDGVNGYTVLANTTAQTLIGLCEMVANVAYTLSCSMTGTPTARTRNRWAVAKSSNMWDGTAVFGNDFYTAPQQTFTPSENGTYYFFIWSQGIDVDVSYDNFMCEFGSTAHDYEPYTAPTTYTAQLGRTVYGGTADLVTGEGVDGYGYVDLGTLTWTKRNTSSGHWHFTTQDVPVVINDDNSHIPSMDCVEYTAISPSQSYNGVRGVTCNTGISQLMVCDETYETANDFRTAVSGVYLVYPLATPTNFTFTGQEIPTMLGYNAFWSDQGDTEVTYRADINLALQALSGLRGLMMARPQLEPETEPEETIEETPEEMER